MKDIVSHKGFIMHRSRCHRSQKRGGKGVIGSGQYEDTEHLFTASTHDYIMCFMNSGRSM